MIFLSYERLILTDLFEMHPSMTIFEDHSLAGQLLAAYFFLQRTLRSEYLNCS